VLKKSREGKMMLANTSEADARTAVGKSHPGPIAPKPARQERIDWLFRDALRSRQVHPLMELVRRYRERDTR
jgi:hypothetical protein